MKKVYTKKIFSISFAFCLLMLCCDFCFAGSSEIKKTITSEVSFVGYFMEPTMEHEAIPSVVANGILNAKVYVDFGDCTSANTYLEYNFDGSSTFTTITKENINSKYAFYMGVPKEEITPDKTKIYYRVKTVLQSSEGEKTLYAPEGASETAFVSADVVKSIECSLGETKEVFCGDQSKTGNSAYMVVKVPAGAYSGDKKVTVNFLEDIEA